MEHAVTPKQLYDTIKYLVRKGAKGILISGGFDPNGRLPIEPFLPVIREVKKKYNIVISVHAGLVDKNLAQKLRDHGIDIVDYELIVDPIVISKVKHLNKKPEDFIKSYEVLINHGPPYVAPHIPIGFNYGRIVKEYEAIDIVKDYNPYVTVFLVFIPTKNTPMENTNPPRINEIVNVLKCARQRISGEIALGCMRPWTMKHTLDEIVCRERLVDRIVNPLRRIIKKYGLETINACCSIPKEYLHLFIE